MPSDSSGVHTLPAGYLAIAGEAIEASQHNPPLEDISSGLTARLMRSGVAAMTGPLKLADGTAGAPALTFASATTVGIYKTASGIGFSVGGVQVAEIGAAGIGIPVGIVVDYAGSTAPSFWLLCYGQAVSRATYSALFAAIGTDHGAGDGSTTFNLPDHRGRVAAGKDNMGGTSANRLTAVTGGIDGDVLGNQGGSETHTLTQAQLPNVSPTFTGSALAPHKHTYTKPTGAFALAAGGFYTNVEIEAADDQDTSEVSAGTPAGTISALGSGTAHNNVQPTIILNKIIYAGA